MQSVPGRHSPKSHLFRETASTGLRGKIELAVNQASPQKIIIHIFPYTCNMTAVSHSFDVFELSILPFAKELKVLKF